MAKEQKHVVTYHPRQRAMRSGPTCIDLFSGAGGLAEGFRQAGWTIVSGNDIDSDAAATFRLNFPCASFFEGPIALLKPQHLLADAGLGRGELDCLIGGPPCQSFSYNNHERSASDLRARLFRKYLHIVEALYPKTLVMENVPGMLTIDGGKIVEEIKNKLKNLGYASEVRILYAEDYGVPQFRRRAFFIASRIGDPRRVFPNGSHGPASKPSIEANVYVHRWRARKGRRLLPFVTVDDAISDLPILRRDSRSTKPHYRSSPNNSYQRKARGGRASLFNHLCHTLSRHMHERIKWVPEGGNWRNIPRRLLPAGMKRAKRSDHTKRYGRLNRFGLASTILTKCDPHWGAYIHPTQNRTLSVREAARLQSFPDKFRFAGRHISKQYEQVGNAVPVLLAKALGHALKRHLVRLGKAPRPILATEVLNQIAA